MDYKYLGKINNNNDIKKLDNDELKILCAEIRDCIIKTVSKNGGHLASNLGSVELTVALHKCFNIPMDTLVFDVGHQCYAHKLLTGRFADFDSLRKENGISGFMKPQESDYDPFITGHSSTSVSSAYGVLKANQILNNNNFSIAVIGDGALTGGMVYEAFNNLQKKDHRFIVILNDNKMSISKNKGSLAKHLTTIRTRSKYFKFKLGIEQFLIKIPFIGRSLRNFVFNIKNIIKNAIYNSNIFEHLGFYYMGPIDGHNIKTLTEVLTVAKTMNRPILLHVKTIKGKGFYPAECNPSKFHGVSKFNCNTGELPQGNCDFSSVFGKKLCSIAEHDKKICAITAAMQSGTGLSDFSKKYPKRFFDVGIAEEHATTFSAALAKSGLKPVFAVYSTFLQRGYDQIIHDVAIADLPLTIAIDRAGLVGNDGETHQGVFDVSFLSNIPNIKIYSPAYFDELELLLEQRLENPIGVVAIRYPRGVEPTNRLPFKNKKGYDIYGKADTVVITYGVLIDNVIAAYNKLKQQGIDICLIKLTQISPLPDSFINDLMQYRNVLFFEEGMLNGGIAQKTGFLLSTIGFNGCYKANAINDFVKQASVEAQRRMCKIDTDSIVKQVLEVIKIE